MQPLPRFLIILLLATLPLAGCDSYSKDIDAVRQSRTLFDDRTNDELAREIAGARGKVEWSAGRPDKYKDNEHIVGVDATIDKTTRAGAKRVVVLHYIHNRQTQQIAFDGLEIDGRPQDLIGGALNLLLMQLE
jgi:hypothetical protein